MSGEKFPTLMLMQVNCTFLQKRREFNRQRSSYQIQKAAIYAKSTEAKNKMVEAARIALASKEA
tara:strand:+ start:365 stop:556 length:192 start_codon:yes stop_codon:yes gene_type:complete